FNIQMRDWLAQRANQRKIRSLGDRPTNVLAADLTAMTVLPPHPPSTGFSWQIRLGRDYYVRFDTNDYSVDPTMISRLVQITATLDRLMAVCDGTVVADHPRCWARQQIITDPAHVTTAKALRADFNRIRRQPTRPGEVVYRPLSIYDELFGLTSTTDGSDDVGQESA
ncbi:MAG: IS21 family transposase, partial [Yaniella sp.]|nr:IS21 family transposase [Yaniella sp.]